MNSAGAATTPAKVMKMAPPVTTPALPGGEMRASSASMTPFQPIAEVPNTTPTP